MIRHMQTYRIMIIIMSTVTVTITLIVTKIDREFSSKPKMNKFSIPIMFEEVALDTCLDDKLS